MARKNNKDRNGVFLDTSVVIAALLSSEGGSFYIISSLYNRYHFQIGQYVLEELFTAIHNKFSARRDLVSGLFSLLGTARVEILPDALKSRLKILKGVISEKDAPILASALDNSDYLITLDKEFLGVRVADFSRSRGLLVMNPREFIALSRGEK